MKQKDCGEIGGAWLMAFDIYGNYLRPGHCEVHPEVPELFPCYRCIEEGREREHVPERCLPKITVSARAIFTMAMTKRAAAVIVGRNAFPAVARRMGNHRCGR